VRTRPYRPDIVNRVARDRRTVNRALYAADLTLHAALVRETASYGKYWRHITVHGVRYSVNIDTGVWRRLPHHREHGTGGVRGILDAQGLTQ
jgi:hypothetical protein